MPRHLVGWRFINHKELGHHNSTSLDVPPQIGDHSIEPVALLNPRVGFARSCIQRTQYPQCSRVKVGVQCRFSAAAPIDNGLLFEQAMVEHLINHWPDPVFLRFAAPGVPHGAVVCIVEPAIGAKYVADDVIRDANPI